MIVELLGVDDIPLFVAHLRSIRAHDERLQEVARG